jgi:hypothetical protein
MTAVTFDTLKFVRRLKEAGVPEAQAEAEAEALAEALGSSAVNLATKADIETVRREIAELKSDLIKWMAGLIIGSMGFMTTLFVVIVKFL